MVSRNIDMLPGFITMFSEKISDENMKEVLKMLWKPLKKDWKTYENTNQKLAHVYNKLFSSDNGKINPDVLLKKFENIDTDKNSTVDSEEVLAFFKQFKQSDDNDTFDDWLEENKQKIIDGDNNDGILSLFEMFDMYYYIVKGRLSRTNVYIYAKFYEYILEQTTNTTNTAKPPDTNTSGNNAKTDTNTAKPPDTNTSGNNAKTTSGNTTKVEEMSNVIIRF